MAYKIFIGSSSKAEPYVRGLHAELNKKKIGGEIIEPLPWTHAFDVGETTIDALLDRSEECDAAVFIFSRDDFVTASPEVKAAIAEPKKDFYVTRDNVVLELGIFLGRLGRDRVFFALPKNHEDLHLPSDVKGVTHATYNTERTDHNEPIAMMECCDAIVRKLSKSQSLPPRPKLLDVFNKLQKEVANLVTTTNTHAIGIFPSYFKGHICRLVEESQHVWIASDVYTYAVFSDKEASDIYMKLIQDAKRTVKIIIPSADRIPDYIKRQIPPDEWTERSRTDAEFQHKLEQFEELTARDKFTTPEQFYVAAVEYQQEKISRLRTRTNHKITIIEKDIEMPMFLWIGDEREAIFSIPIDKTTGSVFEHSFITKDPDLIRALRATWERYAALGQTNKPA